MTNELQETLSAHVPGDVAGQKSLTEALQRLATSVADIHEFIREQFRRQLKGESTGGPAADGLPLEVQKELLRRVCELESMITLVRKDEEWIAVCSHCRRVRVTPKREGEAERWIPLEDYLRLGTSIQCTHGICDDCGQRHYPDLFDREAAR